MHQHKMPVSILFRFEFCVSLSYKGLKVRIQVLAQSVRSTRMDNGMSRSDESTGDEATESSSVRSSAVSSPEPLDEPPSTPVEVKSSYIDCSDESLQGEKALLHLAARSRILFIVFMLLPLSAGMFVISRNPPEIVSILYAKDFLTCASREKTNLGTTTKSDPTTIRPRRFRPIVSNRSPNAPEPLVEKNAPEFVLPELIKFLAGRSNKPHKAGQAKSPVETPPPPVGRVRPQSIRDMIRATHSPQVAVPPRYATIRIGGSRRRYAAIRIRRVPR